MKRITTILLAALMACAGHAQTKLQQPLLGDGVQERTPLKKVYNEQIDPMAQIDQALAQARTQGKYVVCQVGGNWCPWCLRLADFIRRDSTVARVIDDNFVYIHVNYNPRKSASSASGWQATGQGKPTLPQVKKHGGATEKASAVSSKYPTAGAEALMQRLGNPRRFGFPVLVVLDADGRVLHIQDSSFLEEGKSYNAQKLLRFLNSWTPKAVQGAKE